MNIDFSCSYLTGSWKLGITYQKLKEHSTVFGNRVKPRVKQLSFTVFEYIQPISVPGGSTFSLA